MGVKSKHENEPSDFHFRGDDQRSGRSGDCAANVEPADQCARATVDRSRGGDADVAPIGTRYGHPTDDAIAHNKIASHPVARDHESGNTNGAGKGGTTGAPNGAAAC